MKIIVTSHGALCNGILESYQMIAGSTNNIIAIPLTPDDTGQYKKSLKQVIEKYRQYQLLILCDIAGGTPYNESFQNFLKHPDSIRVISGLNLAMLLEVGLAVENIDSINDLANLAIKSGMQSVVQAKLVSDSDSNIEF